MFAFAAIFKRKAGKVRNTDQVQKMRKTYSGGEKEEPPRSWARHEHRWHTDALERRAVQHTGREACWCVNLQARTVRSRLQPTVRDILQVRARYNQVIATFHRHTARRDGCNGGRWWRPALGSRLRRRGGAAGQGRKGLAAAPRS